MRFQGCVDALKNNTEAGNRLRGRTERGTRTREYALPPKYGPQSNSLWVPDTYPLPGAYPPAAWGLQSDLLENIHSSYRKVEDTDPSSAGSGGRGVEFSLLIDGVGRAWRAEDLHHKQHSITGERRRRRPHRATRSFVPYYFREVVIRAALSAVPRLLNKLPRPPAGRRVIPRLMTMPSLAGTLKNELQPSSGFYF